MGVGMRIVGEKWKNVGRQEAQGGIKVSRIEMVAVSMCVNGVQQFFKDDI